MLEVLLIDEIPCLIIPPKDPTLETTGMVASPTSIIVPDGDKDELTEMVALPKSICVPEGDTDEDADIEVCANKIKDPALDNVAETGCLLYTSPSPRDLH